MTNLPTISVFSPNPSSWRWYEEDLKGRIRLLFGTEEPQRPLERRIQKPKLSRIFGAFRCVQQAIREHAVALAAHSQFSTLWSSIMLRLLGSRIPLLAFSFHFSRLPTGPRLLISKWAYSRVRRFAVHSEAERIRYSSCFDISIEKFQLVRWGVQPSSLDIEHGPPQISGTYICAIGKDGRDYRTLIRAMERLPHLTMVVVAQPHNLIGVQIPQNVKVLCDIPLPQAMNILKHCQFMALPLETNETSCGHITLVWAMFCRKAIVATASTGIADYFPEGYAAPRISAGDVDEWVRALAMMANEGDRRQLCGSLGWQYAHQFCSHEAALEGNLEVFRNAGVAIA